MTSLPVAATRRIASHREAGLYRARRTVENRAADDPNLLRVDGHDCVGFCGNDYLSLRADSRVVAAFRRAATDYGVGSGASHLISGHHREHRCLEEELAEFTGRARALLFSSGYMANLGLASTLLGRHDTFVEDRLNHASLLDAARLSGARLVRYRHADADALAQRLDHAAGQRLVATDGVFSMDGDVAPLPELASACRRHDAWLMVDDAHGFGVLGATGRGSLEHCDVGNDDVPVLMLTLGKALGSAGAAIVGEADLIDALVQQARTYIYTTALPPAVAAAARAALAIVREDPAPRAALHANIARFRSAAAAAGLELGASMTPIQPLPTGTNGRTMRIGERLFAAGFWVGAIRPPTVPAGTARLRITLSSAHRADQIDALVEALAGAIAAEPA